MDLEETQYWESALKVARFEDFTAVKIQVKVLCSAL
jgi:hypothetical protein